MINAEIAKNFRDLAPLILPVVSTIIIITKQQPKEQTQLQGDSLIEPMSGIVLNAGNILTTIYTQNVT